MFHQYFAAFFMKMSTNIFSKCFNIFQENSTFCFLASSTLGPAAGRAPRRYLGAAPARRLRRARAEPRARTTAGWRPATAARGDGG
jgi:hypothetical protein